MPAAKTYIKIASQTLSSAASSVTFSNLPQNYTDLVILTSYSRSASGNGLLRVNSDTGSNYSYTYIFGDGSSATSSRGSNYSYAFFGYESANLQNAATINILNYSNTTTYKTITSKSIDTAFGVVAWANLWRSTAAITSIQLYPNSGNFNSGSTFTIYGIECSRTPTASGGVVYNDGSYWYHVFRSTGSFYTPTTLTADVLTVAGGGSGGWSYSGGGAGGGIFYQASTSLTQGFYTCTVGGGATGAYNTGLGQKGSDSQFGSLTAAVGGGGGAGSDGAYSTARNGGSGGGGHAYGRGNPTTDNAGGTATSGQGNAGGSGSANGSATDSGGGGGGAGAAGGNATSTAAGNGGNGSSSYSSWGLATGTGENISGTYYYAGGGGGGTAGSNAGTGGYGGGGRGARNDGTQESEAGIANTGGGSGGGAAGAAPQSPKNAGSGIIIVRYAV